MSHSERDADRIRVLLCPSAFFPSRGGVEELTLKLAQGLQARGHEVEIVTNRWPAGLPKQDEVEGIRVTRLEFTLPARRPGSVYRHYGWRHSVLADLSSVGERAHVLHIQCASSQTWYMHALAKQQGLPLVLTTQGETDMDAGQLYQRNRFMRAYFRSAAGAAAATTACSEWTRRRVETFAPAFERAQVIPNGVEPDDWQLPRPTEAPVIAAWGRLVPQKGFDLLLEAFRHVKHKVPDAQLLLAGSGDPSALSLAGRKGIQFLGPLDRGGVRALLSRARIVAVPSRLEPFGIVALEALAAGRGLVYSDIGGLAEAAGRCGRSANPYNATQFGDALLQELEHPTPYDMGRQRAQELSWANVVTRYEDLYKRVLAPPQRGR